MNKEQTTKLTPFVKWIGGKKQFLPYLDTIIPDQYDRYVELFVGGGSLFFHLQPKKAIINDINRELITSYLAIKSNPQELITSLEKHKQNHSKEFHTQMKLRKSENNLEMASRFIYLNKASFNGLYRLNSKGEFNAGFNKQESITLFDRDNILAISEYLRNNEIVIYSNNYRDMYKHIRQGDFIFCDPPYDIDREGGFTSYTSDKFTKEDQTQLLSFLKECEKKGAKWLLTNHSTGFIKDLYKDYSQIVKPAYRVVNSKGTERGLGTAEEVFITSYPLPRAYDEKGWDYCQSCKNNFYICAKKTDWEGKKVGCGCMECSIMREGQEVYQSILKERKEYANAREEFERKKKETKTGTLILLGKKIFHFVSRKEWDDIQSADQKIQELERNKGLIALELNELELENENKTEPNNSELQSKLTSSKAKMEEINEKIKKYQECKEKYKRDMQFSLTDFDMINELAEKAEKRAKKEQSKESFQWST